MLFHQVFYYPYGLQVFIELQHFLECGKLWTGNKFLLYFP